MALRRSGIDDLMIIERADGVGGTWRRNTYPGRGVRHPEPPVLVLVRAEPGLEPHLRPAARDPGLSGVGGRRLRPAPPPAAAAPRCGACAGTPTRAQWDGSNSAPSGSRHTGRRCGRQRRRAVRIRAGYPDIDGLADFGGTLMHTAQWDPRVDLTGKRVAVVGTGASGVQVVPELAEVAGDVDGIPAHAAVDGAQGGPPLQRAANWPDSGVCPWAIVARAVAAVETAARQHRVDPPTTRGWPPAECRDEFLRKHVADERLRDALTPRLPVPLQAGPARRATTTRHCNATTSTWSPTPSTGSPTRGIITADGMTSMSTSIVLATGFETSSYLSGLEVVGVGRRKPA